MATGQFAGVYRQIGRLFQSGCVAGLTEGQLLDRFVAHRDDTAFEAIVARHGAMVLGVCRANLRDPNDVEDAFQATFLVLVKKAHALRDRDLLANWLYGVAHRVARRARLDAAKRRDRLPTGPEPVAPDTVDVDVRPCLHDEVNRLPESYRAAVVLCYFEGRTHEEAALELGWPVGTVRGRLARARDLLRTRLTRRGLALSSGAVTTLLAESSSAAVGPSLAALPFATNVAATVSPRVIALAGGVLHAMSATKLKLGLTLLVAAAIAAPGVSAYQNPDFGKAATKTAAPVAKPNLDMMKATIPTDDRVRLAREAIATLDALSREGTNPQATHQISLWYRRLIEAQTETGSPALANSIRDYVEAAKQAEALAKSRADTGQGTKYDILNAQYERVEAERFAADLHKKARADGQLNPVPSAPVPHGDTMGVDPESPTRLRKFPKQDPADASKNEAIEKALERELTLNFPKGTPLDEIVQFIRKNTVDPRAGLSKGIPIYVDPLVLIDDEGEPKTNPLTIAVDFEGIPIRVSLRLILNQLDLAYQVRDRMVYICDEELIDMRYNDGFIARPTFLRGPGGMGMGMGPGGGMPQGMPAGAPVAPTPVKRTRNFIRENPADAKADAVIEKALEDRMPMAFPNETPLEDVLKYVKSNTASEKLDLPSGVVIYVDPVGLKHVQATITTPVSLDLEAIPLRTSLRLVLQQLGLDYRVRDAMVYISDAESLAADDQHKAMSDFTNPPAKPTPEPAPKAK